MRIGFAAAIACRINAHQPGILPILHIAFQNAIFDQYIAAACCAFIINGNRAPPVGHGAIVNNGHTFGGNLLANFAAEHRRALAVEITFKPMANSFMQHDAGPASAKHNFHLASRCRHRIEIQHGNAQRLINLTLPGFWRQPLVEHNAATGTGAARFHPPIFLNRDPDIDPHQRTNIGHAGAIGAHDLHRLPRPGQAGIDLFDAAICGARIAVHLLQ